MQIKTIFAGAIAGICLAAPVLAADGHDAMKSHELSNLSGTVTGAVLDGVVTGKLNLGGGSSSVDPNVDPYTARARAQEQAEKRLEGMKAKERRDRSIRHAERVKAAQARIDRAAEKAKAVNDKASRSKRSDRQKSASRERKRDK